MFIILPLSRLYGSSSNPRFIYSLMFSYNSLMKLPELCSFVFFFKRRKNRFLLWLLDYSGVPPLLELSVLTYISEEISHSPRFSNSHQALQTKLSLFICSRVLSSFQIYSFFVFRMFTWLSSKFKDQCLVHFLFYFLRSVNNFNYDFNTLARCCFCSDFWYVLL